ncbi:MAG: hypothetical protein Q9227_005034 [Pyrenula ochraceoflavens]
MPPPSSSSSSSTSLPFTSDDASFFFRLLAASPGPFNYRGAALLEGKQGTASQASNVQVKFKKMVEARGLHLVDGRIMSKGPNESFEPVGDKAIMVVAGLAKGKGKAIKDGSGGGGDGGEEDGGEGEEKKKEAKKRGRKPKSATAEGEEDAEQPRKKNKKGRVAEECKGVKVECNGGGEGSQEGDGE